MSRVVEILLYSLVDGMGVEFHEIMHSISIPLHKSAGMDVVTFGSSLHNSDAYYLLRAYDSLQHLNVSQDKFYSSDAWINGPRKDIVDRIVSSEKIVIPLKQNAIDYLKKTDW